MSHWIRKHPIITFPLIYLGWAYIFWIPVLLSDTSVWESPSLVWFLVGGASPLIAGILLTLGEGGRAQLGNLFWRLVDWRRISFTWWFVILLFWLFFDLAMAGIARSIGITESPLHIDWDLWQNFTALLFLFLLSFVFPAIEEIGLRGYYLDTLRRTLSPVVASMVNGVVWAAWHAPFVWFPGYYAHTSFHPELSWWLPMIVCQTLLIAYVYFQTRRSILAVLVFHGMMNFTGEWLRISPDMYPFMLAGNLLMALLVILAWQKSCKTDSQSKSTVVENAEPKDTLRVNFNNLKGLPKPVEKYFRYALKDGQEFIRLVRLEQTGTLKISPKSKSWSLFKASQIISQNPVSFMWNAKINLSRFFHVRVSDSFYEGIGDGKVSLMSVITIAHERNIPELNSGALYRYLAEAVWHPTSLLPESGVNWEPVDDNKAIAHLSTYGISISLEFNFNSIGEITGIYTRGRYGKFGNKYMQYPWEGKFYNYHNFNGIKIPIEGEVGWHLPDGWWLFWKGQVIKAEFEFENEHSACVKRLPWPI